ncbi:MAG TPA: transketolase C-terminal domain-containing protein [Candidatus Paceibacterota bacterium]|nr:transketolase C-terminal domain-containing protein [Candidatus Paceibacterota bacterium]
MRNPDVKLAANIFEKPEMAPTRDGFGKGSVEAGKADPRVVVLSADLEESTRAEWFHKEFPERFIEMGVAEQNMATVAAGMANYGKIPFITSYAAFSPGRNWEQIRTTIALNNVPVIVCGMHAGVSVGPDGATHQMLEDIALMRAMPNMTVLSPCDAEEARKATMAAAKRGSPVYIRFGREKTPVMTTADTPFEIGKAQIFWKSDPSLGKAGFPSVAVFATGPLVHNALLAAQQLEKEGVAVTVVNVSTIKPLDPMILEIAKSAGAVVTVEEHQVNGGLGGAIAELLAKNAPRHIEFVGVQDQFGQSGKPDELIEHYQMGVSHIAAAIKSAMSQKN